MSLFEYMLEHKYEDFYRIRDYCRDGLVNEAVVFSVDDLLVWLKKEYVTFPSAIWGAFAEEMLLDAQQLIDYEQANDLPVEP
jgi:hypothetical protein